MRWLIARRLMTDRGDVDDCLQQTFLEVLTAIRAAKLEDPERLMGFVQTVARRKTNEVIERKLLDRATAGALKFARRAAPPLPDEELMQAERRELMVRTLAEMPPREREILTRFYLDEQKPAQICREMGLTETQYRLMKFRAKAKFGEIARHTTFSKAA